MRYSSIRSDRCHFCIFELNSAAILFNYFTPFFSWHIIRGVKLGKPNRKFQLSFVLLWYGYYSDFRSIWSSRYCQQLGLIYLRILHGFIYGLILFYRLTNSMVKGSLLKVDSPSDGQEIPSSYGIKKSSVFTEDHISTLSWASWIPFYILIIYFLKIHFRIFLTTTPSSPKPYLSLKKKIVQGFYVCITFTPSLLHVAPSDSSYEAGNYSVECYLFTLHFFSQGVQKESEVFPMLN
jgi:hypothetical protein